MTIEQFQKELKLWNYYVEITKDWNVDAWHHMALKERDALIKKFFSQLVENTPAADCSPPPG